MKIAYICSACVRNDAISAAVRNEILWLLQSGHDVRLYAYACDFPELPFQAVDTSAALTLDRHFYASQMAIFHFGIVFELFNAIFLCGATMRKVVVFHNITPKKFVPTRQVAAIEASLRQMANMGLADQILCGSRYNLDFLRRSGINAPATVLPLAVTGADPGDAPKPSARDRRLRLLFIGRFVPSKGLLDLLAALRLALGREPGLRLEVCFVGNTAYSDPALLERLRTFLRNEVPGFGERLTASLHEDACEAEKQRLLAATDILILPTYHEGFCVPIVEAFLAGCQVIAYDNSNVPFVGGGLAHLVPTGDIEGLAATLVRVARDIAERFWSAGGDARYREYMVQARALARQYDPEQIRQRFLSLIGSLLEA